MSGPTEIPTSFYIPPWMNGYRWIFVAGSIRAEIVPGGPRNIRYQEWMIAGGAPHGFTEKQLADPKSLFNLIESSRLDWMAESIAHLRQLCQEQGDWKP